jgi:hypothetical protein
MIEKINENEGIGYMWHAKGLFAEGNLWKKSVTLKGIKHVRNKQSDMRFNDTYGRRMEKNGTRAEEEEEFIGKITFSSHICFYFSIFSIFPATLESCSKLRN